MNNDRTGDSKDKKALKFFMDDGLWFKKKSKEKKVVETKEKPEPKVKTDLPPEEVLKKEPINDTGSKPVKENQSEESDIPEADEKGFGEVDYAILKSITYGFKTIKQISKTLQIRTIVIEKHIYQLIQEGFMKYFQYCVLTSKGKQVIEDFERNRPEDVWRPIDEFIVSVIEHNKERKVKLAKMMDLALLISIIILIILVIYFGISG